MKIIDIILKEFKITDKFELYIYIAFVILITAISFFANNNIIASISAFFGISYTVLAGRGKIYCYFFGLLSSLLYSYLAFKHGFFGNFALNLFYYFPCQIAGIIFWKKHLKKDSLEIIKTKMQPKYRFIYFLTATILSLLTGLILKNFGNLPLADGFSVIFSVFAMILTVKRCIEQWYFWILVNLISSIMWFMALLNGSNCLATVIMWIAYLILGFYFLRKWKEEIKQI